MTNSMDDYKAIAKRAKELGLMTEPKKEGETNSNYILGNAIAPGDGDFRILCDICGTYLHIEELDSSSFIMKGSLAYIQNCAIKTIERWRWKKRACGCCWICETCAND